ncbi:QWRF motif-containing protein 2-like isoform X2 [Olea europaea var. sylvestris]|uniref:QWRF motif-containing protein 2-like isoform X1 n=1 Tax=Olea europaea var. sylvestris TaxID=158386 RepID=UPI000C1D3FEB|nr:QWRF motif-containing protein 2-like isoform X1 [Olea europaea var. sylvestris]XP_022888195.1 QWRF motif-containing protein 2-like isoform X2 [Olea europaea var. sylvestris]
MVAAVSENPKIISSRRSPLLSSEKEDKNGVSNNTKRPKSRIVSSRYMSPSTSTSTSTSTSNSSSISSSSSSSGRYPSPLVSRNSTPVSKIPSLCPKRSVSADRRRPVAARPLAPDLDSKHGNLTEVSAAAKLLVTSTRSLSVSFQGEAFSLPISKTKAAPPSPNLSSVRKGTPERRRSSTPLRGKRGGDQVDNSKNVDQHMWPAKNRLVNPLSRSADCSGCSVERSKLIGSGSVVRAFQQPMIDERKARLDGRSSLDLDYSDLLKTAQLVMDRNLVNNESSVPSDLTASDSDSVSSGSPSEVQESGGDFRGRSGPRGIVGSARFWQETHSRLRRLQDPGLPLSTNPSSKLIVPPKLKKYASDGPLSSSRTMSSPIRGGIRPASPSKLMTPVESSPSRGISPSRIRNAVSTITSKFNETPSVLSFAVDVQRGKVGKNWIADAHLLRLLYNRHLQWRFANARTEVVLLVQTHSAEKNLWNAWITISELRDTVTKKRHRLQLLRQKLKLASILKGQMMFLEDWGSLDKDQSISLLGAIKALKASTLRLPVVGGATADIQSLKDAIGSAVDVMQAMTSSICSLLPMVEEVNYLTAELAKVTAKERVWLEQCTDLISMLAAMQVKDSSLRTSILQKIRVSTA